MPYPGSGSGRPGAGGAALPAPPRRDVGAREEQDPEAHEREHAVRDIETGEVDDERLPRGESEQHQAGVPGEQETPQLPDPEREPAADRPQDGEPDGGLLLQLFEPDGTTDTALELVHQADGQR